jgi:hypothetical protein
MTQPSIPPPSSNQTTQPMHQGRRQPGNLPPPPSAGQPKGNHTANNERLDTNLNRYTLLTKGTTQDIKVVKALPTNPPICLLSSPLLLSNAYRLSTCRPPPSLNISSTTPFTTYPPWRPQIPAFVSTKHPPANSPNLVEKSICHRPDKREKTNTLHQVKAEQR